MFHLRSPFKTGLVLGLLAALFLFMPTSPAAAQAPPQVDQLDGIIRDGFSGGSLLIWTEDKGSGNRILARRIFANGLPKGGPTGRSWEVVRESQNSVAAPGDQRWPTLAGNLLIWSEKPAGGADYDIRAQRVNSAGYGYGKVYTLVQRPGNQTHPYVQGEVLVWSEDATDGGDIWGQRITSALRTRGSAFEVATGPGNATEPIIVPDPTQRGYYLVMWTDDRAGNQDIYATRVTDTGLPRGGSTGGQFAVVETPENDYAPAAIISNDSLRGGRDNSSRSLVLWTTDHPTDGPDVLAQRLRSNGYAFGATIPVATGPGAQLTPDVQIDQNGDWVATWSGDNALPPAVDGSLDIYAIDIRFNGIPHLPSRTLAAD